MTSIIYEDHIISVIGTNHVYYYTVGDDFVSHNPLETTAYLLKECDDKPLEHFWNNILGEFRPTDTTQAIYLLSGGDKEWKKGDYLKTWEDVRQLYSGYFGLMMCSYLERAKYFKDCKYVFEEYFDVYTFTDFAITHNLL